MSLAESWEKALKKTEIIRPRVQPLDTFAETLLPYIFLGESALHRGDTVVRKGELFIQKPGIILPTNLPRFEGFEAESAPAWDPEAVMNFFLVRGVRFPSWKYDNKTYSLDIFEGSLSRGIEHFRAAREKQENISTGLVIGPEDCWQFSLLILIAGQVGRQADEDMRRLWEDFRRRFDIF